MNTMIKVTELSVEELKDLIKETMFDTLQQFMLREIDDKEQAELEAMFGAAPQPDEYVFEREIEV